MRPFGRFLSSNFFIFVGMLQLALHKMIIRAHLFRSQKDNSFMAYGAFNGSLA